jgi:hypothetical protein
VNRIKNYKPNNNYTSQIENYLKFEENVNFNQQKPVSALKYKSKLKTINDNRLFSASTNTYSEINLSKKQRAFTPFGNRTTKIIASTPIIDVNEITSLKTTNKIQKLK